MPPLALAASVGVGSAAVVIYSYLRRFGCMCMNLYTVLPYTYW